MEKELQESEFGDLKKALHQLKEKQVNDFLSIKGSILNSQKENDRKRHLDCRHLKGGIIFEMTKSALQDTYNNGDNIRDYSIIKHKIPWGDWWIRCIRCGKWWKPGDEDYDKALAFPTRNTISTSGQFDLLPEKLAYARELTRGT